MVDHFQHGPDNFKGFEHQMLRKMELVYMLAASGGNFYKIGRTKCPKQRFSNLQTACPFDLILIAGIRTPSASLVEAHYHDGLAEYRVKGEWFKLPDHVADQVSASFTESARSAREAKSALL